MHKKLNNSLTKKFIQGLRPLANTLPKQIKKIIKKNGFNFSSVVDNWTKIVGKEFSDHCYPINIKVINNSNTLCLVLNVIHGKELEIEYGKNNIIDKINSYFGYNFISKIELKIMNRVLNENEKIVSRRRFGRNLSDIKNINLKEKLNQLIKAYNEKK
tara:strand:+ start:887 stop:1360 length:474 start_codon:yes stop_codon:yes gene_type:complete